MKKKIDFNPITLSRLTLIAFFSISSTILQISFIISLNIFSHQEKYRKKEWHVEEHKKPLAFLHPTFVTNMYIALFIKASAVHTLFIILMKCMGCFLDVFIKKYVESFSSYAWGNSEKNVNIKTFAFFFYDVQNQWLVKKYLYNLKKIKK